MKRLTIHIGAHKTGTTTIQHCLASSVNQLNVLGFDYPKLSWYHFAQHRIAFAMQGMQDPNTGGIPDFDQELRSVVEFLSSTEYHVILSSEEFFTAPLERIKELGVLREIAEVAIVVFIRRQDRLFLSIYNQKIKQPGNVFANEISTFIDDPTRLSADLDFYSNIDRWASVFGKENVTVIRYEVGDALDLFFEAIGVTNGVSQFGFRRLNESIPAKALELIRLVKWISSDIETHRAVLSMATKVFSNCNLSRNLKFDAAFSILRRFDDDNRKLFEEYGLGSDVYSSSTLEEEDFGVDELTRGDVVRIMVNFLEAPDFRLATKDKADLPEI